MKTHRIERGVGLLALTLAVAACQGGTGEAGDSEELATLRDEVRTLTAELTTLRDEVRQLRDDAAADAASDAKGVIEQDVTWVVGDSPEADHEGLRAAMQALQGKRLAPGATVTLTLTPGEHDLGEVVDLGHAQGLGVRVVGDLDDPSAVRLRVRGGSGLRISGQPLGYLGGVTIAGDGAEAAVGLWVRAGGWLGLGPVAIEGFDGAGGACLRVESDASVDWHGGGDGGHGLRLTGCATGVDVSFAARAGLPDLTVRDVSEYGVYCLRSHIWAPRMDLAARPGAGADGLHADGGCQVVATAGRIEGFAGRGVFATRAAVIQAAAAVSRGNGGHGFMARYAGLLFADDATAEDNGGAGVAAEGFASVHATGSLITGNGDRGACASGGAYVDVVGATFSDNTDGPFCGEADRPDATAAFVRHAAED